MSVPLVEALPALAEEIEGLLRAADERALADSIPTLRVLARCPAIGR